MKRMMLVAMVAGVLGAGIAFGGTLEGVKAYAQRAGSGAVVAMMISSGVTNAVEQAAVTNAWDEDVFVDTALKHGSLGMVSWVLAKDTVSASGMAKIKKAVLAKETLTPFVLEIVKRYPVGERTDFKGVLDAYVAANGGAQPERMKLRIKWAVLQGIGEFSEGVDEADLIRVLLAPEALSLQEAQALKGALKARAVRVARLGLRAEGKSFVVKDGVNPLEAKVKPVVDALNAAECRGLEAAFRGLGSTVPDMDRAGLVALATGSRVKIMSGEVSGSEARPMLGKIALALGADGYNRFVDEYNNGTAGGK